MEYLMEMRAYLFRVVNSDCFPYLSIVKKFTGFILDCSSVSFISSDSTFISSLFPHQVKLCGIKIIIVLHILSYHFPTSQKKIRKSADVASVIQVHNSDKSKPRRAFKEAFFFLTSKDSIGQIFVQLVNFSLQLTNVHIFFADT